MPLVSPREMILRARDGGYAVPAFNVENMEMAQAVMQAAEEMRAPVILQTTSSTLRYGGPKLFAAMAAALASDAAVPAAMHLDHGESYALAAKAVRAGYTSLMIDGSKLPFSENAALTKKVAELAAAVGLPVEGEVGKVGGREDDAESSGPDYTDPGEAAEFARVTGVFSLAIGVGTSHGVYTGTPVLDMERISAVARKTGIPLVLHGTSGVPDEDVRECVRRGICKVNYATELRIAFTDGVRVVLAEQPGVFDPKAYLKEGRRRVYEAAKGRIEVCGAEGKALR